jgi:hypothetical protein
VMYAYRNGEGGGVNESSLDGHYSESCELTKEMIVHRKSAIRTCSIDSDRYKGSLLNG